MKDSKGRGTIRLGDNFARRKSHKRDKRFQSVR